jgi:hypothetical protein
VLVAVPVLQVANFIFDRARNVPVGDQWMLSAPIAVQAHDRTLTLAAILEQHNEHRVVPTKLVTVLATWTTDWDVRVEIGVLFALAVANLVIVARLIETGRRRVDLAALVPVAFLMFSYRQRVPWQVGLLNAHFFAILFFLLALLAVRGRGPLSLKTVSLGPISLVMAALACTGATFSVASGLICWPLLLACLWWNGERRPRVYLFWGIAFTACMGLFFTGYELRLPAASVPLGTRIGFSLTFLANPFFEEGDPAGFALAFGCLGLLAWGAVVLYLRWRGLPRRRLTTWLALGLFSLGCALLTAGGRAQMGWHQALGSKYVPYSSLFWVSLSVLVVRAGHLVLAGGHRKRPDRYVFGALLVVLLLGATLYARANRIALTFPPKVSPEAEPCLIEFAREPDIRCLRGLSPFARKELEGGRKQLELMRNATDLVERKLTIFSESNPGGPLDRYR